MVSFTHVVPITMFAAVPSHCKYDAENRAVKISHTHWYRINIEY